MGAGAAIAIAAGALVLVLYVTKRQEQQTAMRATNIVNGKNSAGLSFGDVLHVGETAAAGYLGGPQAALGVAGATGLRL